MKKDIMLDQYFKTWIETYKMPVVAHATYVKYLNTLKQIKRYFGETPLSHLTATSYQQALNEYSITHSKLTVSCFHKQIHACLLDAIDEQIIKIDPARKAIIFGRTLEKEKVKCLDYDEWKTLVTITYNSRNIRGQIVYLSAVTGLRYAEVLGLTWDNVDFQNNKLTINKTWDYKYHKGFIATKNESSKRQIDIDDNTVAMLSRLFVQRTNDGEITSTQIFRYSEGKQLYSANINRFLSQLCENIGIRKISFHSLRHTHASVLLYQGISLMAVSRRLGHSNTATTQNIYIHIIKEMENKEKSKIMQVLGGVFNNTSMITSG
ncbi:MAG: site-specific integrase [Oscillospiraceae bacterium]|jgi:integrase|nr:site-specific integrase [Oscillospiraceae bacterium]